MQLTPQQRRQLLKLHDFQQTPPTVSALLRDSWRAYLYITAVGLVGVCFFLWGGWPIASGIFAGMVLATIVRDIGWFRRLVQTWPLQREVTNWNRVKQLLEQAGGSAA